MSIRTAARRSAATLALACGASITSAEMGDPCSIGPWPIAGSRASVLAEVEHGPFFPVASTGGVETFNATLNGGKANVSFVFDREDGLLYMHHFVYEGHDMSAAKTHFTALAGGWAAQFGGYTVGTLSADGSSLLPAAMAADVFKATVEVPLQAVAAMKAKVVASVLFHVAPGRQPSGCNLHVLYGHMGPTDTFFVYKFVDHKAHVRKVPREGISLEPPRRADGAAKPGG